MTPEIYGHTRAGYTVKELIRCDLRSSGLRAHKDRVVIHVSLPK